MVSGLRSTITTVPHAPPPVPPLLSLVLYALTLLAGLVGCTGGVSLFAYMAQFPPTMTSSLSGGLGPSSHIAGPH